MHDAAAASVLKRLGKLGGQFLVQVAISVAATLCATLTVSGLLRHDAPKIERAPDDGQVTKAEPLAVGKIATAMLASASGSLAEAGSAKPRIVEARPQPAQSEDGAGQSGSGFEALPVALAPIPPVRSRVMHVSKPGAGRTAETASACGLSCASHPLVAAANGIMANGVSTNALSANGISSSGISSNDMSAKALAATGLPSAPRKLAEPKLAEPLPVLPAALPAETTTLEARLIDVPRARAMLALPSMSIRSGQPLIAAGMTYVADVVAGLGRGF